MAPVTPSELADLLPVNGIPKLAPLCNRRLTWYSTDHEEAFQKNGGHPIYGSGDIEYKFNSHGFRSVEFTQTEDMKVLAIGCSQTVGVGVRRDEVYGELFSEKLRQSTGRSVVQLNLGIAGASFDYVTRMLHLAIPLLSPHVVIVLVPALPRRDYVTADNRWFRYNPHGDLHFAENPSLYEAWQTMLKLSSPLDDQLNFFRNYKSMELLLRDIPWAFALSKPESLHPALVPHINQQRLAQRWEFIDNARDHSHMGPISHRSLSDAFWQAIVRCDGIEAITRHLERVTK